MATQVDGIFNYLFKSTAPFIQQHVLGRHRLPNGSWSSSNTTITDLDDYCLANIFRFLTFRDLVRCRRVSRRLHYSVSEYLDTRKSFTYDCDLNGVALSQNGHYLFNWEAFDFALKHMPNLRALSFERCTVMRQTLATCPQDILEHIAANVYDLKVLSIGRSLAVNTSTVTNLIEAFPELTHLTINIFNEELLNVIVDGFKHLKYLNLDESILYDYTDALRRLGPDIHTFIAPADHKDQKMTIVEALCDGNGKKLERLEMKVAIHDMVADAEFFTKIGTSLRRLKWFQCEVSSSHKQTIANRTSSSIYSDEGLDQSLELNRHRRSMSSLCTSQYEHRHLNLIRGLAGLKNLRVLVLKEADYFDSEDRCSIFDDESLTDIFRSCSQLEMLTLSCAIRRNQRDYHRYEFDSKENAQEINRLLNQLMSEGSSKSSQSRSRRSTVTDPAEMMMRLGKKPGPGGLTRSESIFGDMFECADSDPEDCERSIDSGIGSNDQQQQLPHQPHTVSDGCLANLHTYLPKLKILQLRGVRLGLKSLESIAALQLHCLRLDSISFPEANAHASFTDFLSSLTIRTTNIRITNIPLV